MTGSLIRAMTPMSPSATSPTRSNPICAPPQPTPPAASQKTVSPLLPTRSRVMYTTHPPQ